MREIRRSGKPKRGGGGNAAREPATPKPKPSPVLDDDDLPPLPECLRPKLDPALAPRERVSA